MEGEISSEIKTPYDSIKCHIIEIPGVAPFILKNVLIQLPEYSEEQKNEFTRVMEIISFLNMVSARSFQCSLCENGENACLYTPDNCSDILYECINVCKKCLEGINSILDISNKNLINICFTIVNYRWNWFTIINTDSKKQLEKKYEHTVNVLRSSGAIEPDWEIGYIFENPKENIALEYIERKNKVYIPCKKRDSELTKGISLQDFHQYNPSLKIKISNPPEEYTGFIKAVLDKYMELFID